MVRLLFLAQLSRGHMYMQDQLRKEIPSPFNQPDYICFPKEPNGTDFILQEGPDIPKQAILFNGYPVSREIALQAVKRILQKIHLLNPTQHLPTICIACPIEYLWVAVQMSYLGIEVEDENLPPMNSPGVCAPWQEFALSDKLIHLPKPMPRSTDLGTQ